MGNSKQKIIEKLNCIPDDLSEEDLTFLHYIANSGESLLNFRDKPGAFLI